MHFHIAALTLGVGLIFKIHGYSTISPRILSDVIDINALQATD